MGYFHIYTATPGSPPKMSGLEKRVALIHRVIVPDEDSPKEYSILVTDKRSIFIRQEQTRSRLVLRGEMKYGTALVTDAKPKTLQGYEQTSLETLESDKLNISVPHEAIVSLAVRRGDAKVPFWNFPVWLTMKRQGHGFSRVLFRDELPERCESEDYPVIHGPVGSILQAEKDDPK